MRAKTPLPIRWSIYHLPGIGSTVRFRRIPQVLAEDELHQERTTIGRGARVDIASWLSRLGLGQYEQAFLENNVDAEGLPELTADDLMSIGVTSIGHRRKCSPRSPRCARASHRP